MTCSGDSIIRRLRARPRFFLDEPGNHISINSRGWQTIRPVQDLCNSGNHEICIGSSDKEDITTNGDNLSHWIMIQRFLP